MPRQARLDAPGTLHHIIIRGIDGLQIFKDNEDRLNFISRLRDLLKDTGNRVLAWVLMENHIHLLLFSGSLGIVSFMRRLLTGYALYYNRKYQRKGHLFQNRYKSIVCEEEPYLLELVRYIHLNPLRAGLVKTVEALDQYPWSGHGVLIGEFKNDWQEVDYVLKLFTLGKRRAIQVYRKFVEEGQNQGKRNDLTGGGLIRSLGGWSQVLSLREKGEYIAHDPRILGSGQFVTDILKEADKNLKRQMRSGERKNLIEQVIKEICQKEGIEEKELRGGSPRRAVSRVRSRIAYQLNRDFGITMAEIARNVGVCTTAVIKAVKKMEAQEKKL
ncbi:MAG: transposase [Thermodesulfobacteriota bacterium]